MRRRTIIRSIIVAALLVLAIPVAVAAQRDYGYGRQGRYLRDTINRLDNSSTQFARDVDREVNHNWMSIIGIRRDNFIRVDAAEFRRAVRDLSASFDGRDLDRTSTEAQRVFDLLGDRIGRMAGSLYVVATPIGNLEDITYRAVRVLGEVDLIACEDTRHTRKLLNHLAIETRTISYHEHNERERAVELLALLQQGSSVAIVSDAGTPGINDPGFRLVRLAVENGVRVVPLPGPSALVTALVSSGLP